ncbi:morphogenetic protein [Klebsiella pneumoniae]|uniref:morphogenetic protein n=1 Tax=Klebsiella pneumoniae TaxID=573 RepID=UPI002786D1BE|nr:morphogenetic protein [Klebsiella pneumoniae]MDT9820842.1 morphogenetic protein [Klebsiella pneumoniae]HDS9361821.1 morphogenetic protein [Klebsiella pneumoniae subsp. pneumoniae]
MKERGMIFNGEMVRAILDGRKTQTRRIIKDCTVGRDQISKFIQIEKKFIGCYPEDVPELIRECCPYGVPGDRIWVRETFQGPLFNYEQMDEYLEDSSKFEKPEFCQYAADGGHRPEYQDADDNLRHGWRPSIHMPRWASRIQLEITGVRVERLQSITLGDICKEVGCGLYDFRPATYGFQVWEELWKSIYGAESWNANPWVWVIEFKRVEGGAV